MNGQSGGFSNPVFGGNVLIRPAVKSPNYQAGVQGWQIARDGSAEFNNLTIRGTFYGTDYIISSAGIFLYSGTPAAGNLVGSWASAAGTDAFGNTYPLGFNVSSTLGGGVSIDPTDGILLSTSPNANTVLIKDGEIQIAHQGDSSGALVIQNFRGGTRGTISIEGGPLASSDVNAYIALITKLVGNDPIVQIGNARNGGQASLVNDTIDMGRGLQSQASITANVSGITTTETVLMTVPSMTYKNGRAYRVTVWGLAQSTTASTYFLYRLRKGSASTSGTIYKDQMRVPVRGTASTHSAVSLVFTLVNTSGADITTAVTLTGSCAAGTGIFAASSGNVATTTVEDVGLATQWPGQPIS